MSAKKKAVKQAKDAVEKQAKDTVEKQAKDTVEKQAKDEVEKQAKEVEEKQVNNVNDKPDVKQEDTEEAAGDEPMEEEAVKESKEEAKKESKEDAKDQSKEESQAKENGEQAGGKRALLRPLVESLKECVEQVMDLTNPDAETKEDVAGIVLKTRKVKELADEIISLANRRPKRPNAVRDCQYIAKIQGLKPPHIKDLRNILQNTLGLGTIKFAPNTARNASTVEIHFFSEEIMNQGLKIIRGKPLGLTLSVVETKMIDKNRLPPEFVLTPLSKEYDATIMFKESLLRTKELTEDECNKMLEWKDKFIQHALKKMCETLDPDIYTVIKDRTEGYFYKVEKIRDTISLDAVSERYQTFSGVNPETSKAEMGYWVLGSDVPSRLPRNQSIRDTLKVLTDFMESSDKPFYDLRVRKGFWDSVMFRTNHVGECMALLIVRCEGETSPAKTCEAFKPQLLELFETGPGKDCKVKSIHMKALSETNKTGTWHLVYGQEYLDEEVAEIKVRLYINSLFWSDSGCTKKLCETIAEELSLDQETGVLEMGIATGLICMYLAKRCKVVVGLDRVQNVILLAKKNLELNELKNVVLIEGSQGTTITSLKTHFKECENVHAFIMETSSNTRNRDEMTSIRKSSWIKKVVYLIISYKDVKSSLRQLCSKHADTSDPFVIVKAIPFDTASASFRPDVLLVLERASALDGRTEKRVPKTKPRLSLYSPASKRARLDSGMSGRPRSLLAGKKLRPPLMREPIGPGRGGYMERGFAQNRGSGFGLQRGSNYAWDQGDVRRPLLSFDADSAARMRAVEDAEALLVERARRQKEEQLQQLQEVVFQAQRRQLADALLPTPPVANIEEVVLSAIQKTGLLQKVAALTEAPQSRMDMESTSRDTEWSRYNERQSPDRWQSDYRQHGSDTRQSRYEARNSPEYRDHGSYGYSDRNTSPEPRGRGSRYQSRGSFGYQNQDTGRSRGGGYYN